MWNWYWQHEGLLSFHWKWQFLQEWSSSVQQVTMMWYVMMWWCIQACPDFALIQSHQGSWNNAYSVFLASSNHPEWVNIRLVSGEEKQMNTFEVKNQHQSYWCVDGRVLFKSWQQEFVCWQCHDTKLTDWKPFFRLTFNFRKSSRSRLCVLRFQIVLNMKIAGKRSCWPIGLVCVHDWSS